MIRRLKRHGLSVLVLAVMSAGAWGAYQHWLFVDRFGVVVPGKLYRCRQPEGREWRLLERLGIRTVVNLRPREEDPAAFAADERACAAAGARLVSIPMPHNLPTEVQARRFLRVVRGSDGPVLVHCEHGEDRTGLMTAAYRVAEQGWTVRKAAAEMRRYGGRCDSDRKWNDRLAFLRRLRAATGP
jgi:uncharacterized protein (TIGR01244 family)